MKQLQDFWQEQAERAMRMLAAPKSAELPAVISLSAPDSVPATVRRKHGVVGGLSAVQGDRQMSKTDLDLYPYSLDVQPLPSNPAKWQWEIRLHGEMLQRSDRAHDSEERARADGLALIERLRRSSGRMF